MSADLRHEIIRAMHQARQAVSDGVKEAVITAIYLDTKTYHALLGSDLSNSDAKALEKGEWAGAPLYTVTRVGGGFTGKHIKATARLI